jgi:putative protease
VPAERVELLAPAGDGAALQAALSAGADAVYVGLDRWSARAFARNFGGEALIGAIDRAHLFGARVHLALNTLLKHSEIDDALAALARPYEAGLDALIVADLGFAALVRERYPGLALHASTQLNAHSSAQLSSMVGGRSGNRGRCSQVCRMRYRLQGVAADADVESARSMAPAAEGDLERALSAADLAAIGVLPALIDAGVTSFKIEGRMKDAAYVAVTTAVYREALDAAAADPGAYTVRDEWLARLGQSFSRTFTTAHLEGRHHEVRSRGRSGHRGAAVGRVEHADEGAGLVTIRLSEPLAPGDVVQIYTPWGHTEALRVGSVVERGDVASERADERWTERLTLRARERVAARDRVFRVGSQEIDEFARDAVAARALARLRSMLACRGGRASARASRSCWCGGRPASPTSAPWSSRATSRSSRRVRQR